MSDELRAAAERIKASAEAWISCQDPDDHDRDHMAHWRDQMAVCAAYLAEHPADDAEPVTEDRLRALPGVSGATLVIFGRRPRVIAAPPSARQGAWVWTYTDADGNIARLPAPSTMGHARRLLAALGIG